MNEAPSSEADFPQHHTDDDVRLMEQVKNGDIPAFEKLVEMHQTRVVRTVAKMLGDETDAEDIAQQVFIRIWKSAPRYKATAKFTTWLFKITRNLVFNEIRRRKRHPATPLETEQESHAFQPADLRTKTPDNALLNDELQQAIQNAIDALPEVQRMAILLRRYEEMPYEEIAEVLKLSVPAVKSILFRARTELREMLKKYLEE